MPENSIRSLFYDVVSKNVSKSLVNHLKSYIFATGYDELRASALQAEGRRFESVNAHLGVFPCSLSGLRGFFEGV